jgi:hypothetical protein
LTRNPAGDAITWPAPVFTIGYGSRVLDDFMRVLQAHEIEYRIDIRSTPYSRFKPEFSKNELEAELRQHVIRYVYLVDIHSTAELARRLGVNETMVTALTGDLTRSGYLAAINTSCATACDGCGVAAACAAPGEPTPHASLLALTPKGQRAVGALSA